MIGYVSLAVGYIVGKAIKTGSRGAGGRRYQIAAVALTYAAVSLAAVPIYISIYAKQKNTQRTNVQPQQTESPLAQDSPSTNSQQETSDTPNRPQMGFAAALAQLAFIGLASPFLELGSDPVHGVIGLVILFVGIRIAWKIAAGTELQIFGPFENSSGAPA